jgi:hypothetical protein
MAPRNVLRVREALLSLLAFKVLYYFLSLADPRTALRAWRRRRTSLRDTANAGA